MFLDHRTVQRIKEQYSGGTRIRLLSMDDPYAPISPGAEGTVDFVDDIGTLHCIFDNGRTLGIIPGEDSFSVLSLPKEPALSDQETGQCGMKME